MRWQCNVCHLFILRISCDVGIFAYFILFCRVYVKVWWTMRVRDKRLISEGHSLQDVHALQDMCRFMYLQ